MDFPQRQGDHIEKTIHPCQFPVELVERFVLSVTRPGDLVFDPFMGVGSTAVAAVLHGRRAAGADTVSEYIDIAKERVLLSSTGDLKTRPMGREVHQPNPNSTLAHRDETTQESSTKRNGTRSPAQGLRIAKKVLEGAELCEDEPRQMETTGLGSPTQARMLD